MNSLRRQVPMMSGYRHTCVYVAVVTVVFVVLRVSGH